MKLKVDEKGFAVLTDGKPTYTGDDGKEFVFDAPQMYEKITSLTQESAKHRKRAGEAEDRLKAYEGLDDPEAARKAIATLQNLDHKKLVDAGEVAKVKEEVAKAMQAQVDDWKTKYGDMQRRFNDTMVTNAFMGSGYIKRAGNVPPDMFRVLLGGNVEIGDDGKLYVKDAQGNRLYSRSKPGEFADFDEGLEMVVTSHPHRDYLLKGSGASGSGAQGGNGSGAGASAKSVKEMTPKDKAAFIGQHGVEAWTAKLAAES